MTRAESDPPADDGPPAGSGGHAWERLREQRAKDLGEDAEPDAAERDPKATDPGADDAPDEPEEDD
jgi:hypothetical protein